MSSRNYWLILHDDVLVFDSSIRNGKNSVRTVVKIESGGIDDKINCHHFYLSDLAPIKEIFVARSNRSGDPTDCQKFTFKIRN